MTTDLTMPIRSAPYEIAVRAVNRVAEVVRDQKEKAMREKKDARR